MSRLPILFSWIAALFLALLSLGSLVGSHWVGGLSAAGIALLLLPPVSRKLQPYIHRFVRYGTIGVLLVIFIAGLPSSQKPTNTTQGERSASSESSPSSQLQNDPEAITSGLSTVKDISVEIFDAQGRMGSNAQAPIEIVVQARVSDCFDAKAKLFDVMKAAYTDQSLRPSIGRIIFNAPPFLRAALDAKDGNALSAESWQSSGPSNFYDILRRVHDGDGGELWRTWVQTLNGCL